MKSIWINQKSNSSLLLFFNGWAMDARPFQHLDTGELDVLMLYDYTEPGNIQEILDAVQGYDKIHLTAWSLGVWAAAECLHYANFKLETATAVNGTLSPVSAECGIAPPIFEGTISSWSEPARIKFNRRMCGAGANAKFFAEHMPERSIEDQKQELISLRDRVNSDTPINKSLFTLAIGGSQDRIFPLAAQQKSWTDNNTEFVSQEVPHYFFSDFKSWMEVVKIGQA
jgi:biotin synthesis protein BioG